jgi:hypothetical protein
MEDSASINAHALGARVDRGRPMRNTLFGLAIFVVLALTLASSLDLARAEIRFDQQPGYFPSGYTRPTSTFDTDVPLLANDGSALELGFTQACPRDTSRQAMISAVGPIVGSTLARSMPVIPYYDNSRMASVTDAAEPTVIVAGQRVRNGSVTWGVEVFAGWPPSERARIAGSTGTASPEGAIAVTRYVDERDFDFAAVNSVGVELIRVSGADASVLWFQDLDEARDVAFVPAEGPMPALVIAVGDRVSIAVDVASGHQVWSGAGGQKVVTGRLGVADAPVFVVTDPYDVGLRAYAANPPTLLWRRDDILADNVLLTDLTGDGHNEIVVGTYRGIVQRITADGVDIGEPLTVPGANGVLDYTFAFASAKFAGGAAERLLIATDAYNESEPRGVFVYPMNLAGPLDSESSQRGVCNAVGVADIDGDGQDEIVTTGSLGGSDSIGWQSTVRIAAPATNHEKWIGTLPGTPPSANIDMYVDFDIGNVGDGVDRDIVFAGPAGMSTPGVVAVLNGATHQLERRATPAMPGANHVTAVRIVPGAAPSSEIVLVGSDFNSTTLHVIDARTLRTTFSSGPLAPAPDAGTVAIATFAGDASAHVIFTVPFNGVYSYDLGTHTLDYSVPASTPIGSLLSPVNGVTRFVYGDYVDGQPVISVIDASTGANLDTLHVASEVLELAGDPNDPERLIVEYADNLAAIRLDTHVVEGVSNTLPAPPSAFWSSSNSLVVRPSGGQSIAYAGTSAGVYAFHLLSVDSTIFRDGFDP